MLIHCLQRGMRKSMKAPSQSQETISLAQHKYWKQKGAASWALADVISSLFHPLKQKLWTGAGFRESEYVLLGTETSWCLHRLPQHGTLRVREWAGGVLLSVSHHSCYTPVTDCVQVGQYETVKMSPVATSISFWVVRVHAAITVLGVTGKVLTDMLCTQTVFAWCTKFDDSLKKHVMTSEMLFHSEYTNMKRITLKHGAAGAEALRGT